MTDELTWAMARLVLGGRESGTLYGKADVTAEQVRRAKLRLKRGWIPPRHVDICGWHKTSDKVADKGAWKVLATVLADSAVVTRCQPLP